MNSNFLKLKFPHFFVAVQLPKDFFYLVILINYSNEIQIIFKYKLLRLILEKE